MIVHSIDSLAVLCVLYDYIILSHDYIILVEHTQTQTHTDTDTQRHTHKLTNTDTDTHHRYNIMN